MLEFEIRRTVGQAKALFGYKLTARLADNEAIYLHSQIKNPARNLPHCHNKKLHPIQKGLLQRYNMTMTTKRDI